MLAANPGPAVHLALLGAVVVVGLVVYAVVRARRRREVAEAERLDGVDRVARTSTDSHRETP